MRRQTLIALAVAVVLGTCRGLSRERLSSARTSSKLSKPSKARPRSRSPRCRWTMAIDITPDKVSFVDYPTASLPPGSFTTIQPSCCPTGKRRVALRPIAGQRADPRRPRLPARARAPRSPRCCPTACAPRRSASTTFRRRRLRPAERHGRRADHAPAAGAATTGRSPTSCSRTSGSSPSTRTRRARTASRSSPGPRRSRSSRSTRRSSRWRSRSAAQPGAAQARRGAEHPAVETVSLNDLRYTYYGGARYAGAAAPAARRRARQSRRLPRRSPPRRAARRAVPAAGHRTVSKSSGARQSSNYEVGGYGS